MKFSLVGFIALSALSSLPTLAASQTSMGFVIAAGPSIPIWRLRDSQLSGFGGTAGLILGADAAPYGIRLSAGYDRLPGRTLNSVVASAQRIISGTGDVLFTFSGSVIKPYISGGLGGYRMQSDTAGAKAVTHFGFNFGSGISFPVPGRSALLEAQLHSISQNNAKPLRVMRIVFGLLL